MITLEVTKVGTSEGCILNEEARRKLGVKMGDTLYLTEAPDGSLRITPYTPEFARQLELAEQLMHDDREVLRALGG